MQKVQTKKKSARASTSRESPLKPTTRHGQPNLPMVSLGSLSLSEPLESQARSLFFAYYVNGFSLTWDFLSIFRDPLDTPVYLTLSIDAVSLAFLFRHRSYPPALALARKKYVTALRETHQTLQAPELASTEPMLNTSMLFDLFEHMSASPALSDAETGQRESSNLVHVRGALALVQSRGLELFDTKAGLRALGRLTTNTIITSVSNRVPVPEVVSVIRKYAAKILDTYDPKWRLSGLMIEYASFVHKMDKGDFSSEEIVQKCLQLDAKYEDLLENRTLEPWLWTRYPTSPETEDVFGQFWDQYFSRVTTQAWNVTRCGRVSLHEIIQEHSKSLELLETSRVTCRSLIEDVLASVPQFTKFHFCTAPSNSLSPPSSLSMFSTTSSSSAPSNPSASVEDGRPSVPENHPHDPAHSLDVFTLLFPLYFCAWSRFCTPAARKWIQRQLHHMSEQWGIRNAAIVAEIIERNEWGDDGTVKKRVDPWDVYRLLGSYAFAA